MCTHTQSREKMYLDLIKQINEYELREYSEKAIVEPITVNELNNFIKECGVILQYVPCDDFINFLKLTNGFDLDGKLFDNAEDFLYENIETHKLYGNKNFIVFGSSGNTDMYTFDKDKKKYNIVNMLGLDDKPYKTFDAFGDLFEGVFQTAYDEQIGDN